VLVFLLELMFVLVMGKFESFHQAEWIRIDSISESNGYFFDLVVVEYILCY